MDVCVCAPGRCTIGALSHMDVSRDPGSAELTESIQAYLRASAKRRYTAVAVPLFTLGFHPTDDLSTFNYAIPGRPSRWQCYAKYLSSAVAGLGLSSLSRARLKLKKRQFLHESDAGFNPTIEIG